MNGVCSYGRGSARVGRVFRCGESLRSVPVVVRMRLWSVSTIIGRWARVAVVSVFGGNGVHCVYLCASGVPMFPKIVREASRIVGEASRIARETSRIARESSRIVRESSRTTRETSRTTRETSRIAREATRGVVGAPRIVRDRACERVAWVRERWDLRADHWET